MPRPTPRTARTVTAVSDGYRALNVIFMRDGELDPEERYALHLIHSAGGHAAMADWQRRARNSYEDSGRINDTLAAERRELETTYGDDLLEA